jgi:hypothetical protein
MLQVRLRELPVCNPAQLRITPPGFAYRATQTSSIEYLSGITVNFADQLRCYSLLRRADSCIERHLNLTRARWLMSKFPLLSWR